MFSTQRAGFLALSTALVVGLGGCALIEPAGTNKPLTGIAACAQGKTWNLDVAALAETVKAELGKQGVAGVEVAGDGKQSLTWELDGKVAMSTDYTLTITSTPAADQTLVVTNKHSGKSTGTAYVNAEVAIPRDWDGTGLAITSTGELNGAAVDTIPYTVPIIDLDDSVGIELTCDGDTLTTHPRGTDITQTWKKG